MKSVIEVIHGFDPSGHNDGITGYVQYNRIIKQITAIESFKTYDHIYGILTELDSSREMVVCEKNHGSMNTKSQFEMCKMVGFIEGLCESTGVVYEMQSPSVRKGYITIAKNHLKYHHKDMYVKHNVDALAHILRYIKSREGIDNFK